jgi:hypothetical protein
MQPLRIGFVGSSENSMPLLKADRCRAMADECRSLASFSEDGVEKTLLTNLSLSLNRLANQADRYAEFMNRPKEK